MTINPGVADTEEAEGRSGFDRVEHEVCLEILLKGEIYWPQGTYWGVEEVLPSIHTQHSVHSTGYCAAACAGPAVPGWPGVLQVPRTMPDWGF